MIIKDVSGMFKMYILSRYFTVRAEAFQGYIFLIVNKSTENNKENVLILTTFKGCHKSLKTGHENGLLYLKKNAK